MNCRFDDLPIQDQFLDLGSCPPSNSLLLKEQLNEPEVSYPLKLFVSDRSWLVQVEEFKSAEDIFDAEYVYFSSYSTSWLAHCKAYVEMITPRLNLSATSQVIEIASNDGYLLQYFKEKEIPCLGIEPTENTAAVAREKGIPTKTEFFTKQLANQLVKEGKKADLVLGNNVFAHVPNINDFVRGLKTVLNPTGTITLEFPHLMELMENNQFDTVYHEHFFYFSLNAVKSVFAHHGLKVYDVETLTTHGGSLRIYGTHKENESIEISDRVGDLLKKEMEMGMLSLDYYRSFSDRVANIKYDLLEFLIARKKEGAKVVAYGAAAKGNTLLNFCGVKNDLIEYVADLSPHKQGKFMPWSHIPIVSPEKIKVDKPNYILILPWNIKEEIMEQLSFVRSWGAKFVTAIPGIAVHS